MFHVFRDWRRKRVLARSTIPDARWERAFAALPLLHRLTANDRQRLRDLAILFLHEKSLVGAHDLEVSEDMAMLIALQACLPILNLGLDWYRGWSSVIVYPAQFVPERTIVDEYGIAHRVREQLSGEAWLDGPVVLSWEDTEDAGHADGNNVVIHEFVHKLDMLNGDANGFPPLHNTMVHEEWVRVFTEAFADFRAHAGDRGYKGISDYAATSPAEFVAVLSEVFFERPDVLIEAYPEIYGQLRSFFQQDPAAPQAGS